MSLAMNLGMRISSPLFASLLLLGIIGSGCAASLDFNSPSPLGVGVNGKYWHAPYFVDAPLYNPVSYAPNQTLLQGYDAVASGSSVQLVGTWHDATETFHKGYARLYNDASGWAAVGAGFGTIATDGVNDLGWPTVAAGPNGLFVANFFASQAGTDQAASAVYNGSNWQSFPPATGLGDNPTWAAGQNYNQGPRAVSAIDALGRAYVFFTGNVSGHLMAGLWQSANASGLSTTLQDVSGSNVFPGLMTAHFDGNKRICVTFELSASRLQAKCVDTTASGLIDFAGASAINISTFFPSGHETATDNAGGLMSVFYQQDASGTYHVYASLGVNGVWPATPVQIDGGLGTIVAPPSLVSGLPLVPGSRPGVAYVGGGSYLAVWVGVDTLSTAKSSALYYSIYQSASGTWTTANQIVGTQDYYIATVHHQALHVFSNGNGNAGFAVNMIKYTGGVPNSPDTAQVPNNYPEANNARVVAVGRWQKDNGWLAFKRENNTFGNVCYSTTVTESACVQRPTGILLPSGNTLVFFQDRDNNGKGTVPGNLRLSVTAFTN